MRAEALRCYAAANIERATDAEMGERVACISSPPALDDPEHHTSSSWQSLKRRTGRVEIDYLNGEILLLGRLHEVPTPVTLRALAVAMAGQCLEPGAFTRREVEEILRRDGSIPNPSTSADGDSTWSLSST